MKDFCMYISVLMVLFLSAVYILVWDDEPNFGNETCLKFAYEILGDPTRGKSCPRSSYVNEVESLNTTDLSRGASIFIFRPIAGKEAQCPPIEVLVDRRSGEPQIIPLDKDGKPCSQDCNAIDVVNDTPLNGTVSFK